MTVAARLLREQGAAAVTTRAVAQAAGVQPPAIYRLFTDKDGLLAAVAEHVLAEYVAGKSVDEDADPVVELRRGWDTHIGFGLDNPALFRLFQERATESAAAGIEVLRAKVHRVAAAGRLTVPEERAVGLVQATGNGAVITLLAVPADRRDPGLVEALWAALAGAILTEAPVVRDASTTTIAFRTLVPGLPGLSGAERAVMAEWIDRSLEG